MNIAEKLIELRNEKGLTQAQLGRELNIALSSIQNYENVKKPRIPEATLLLKIAKYFDVDMEYLLDDELNNRKHDNIVIEKELKLSDKTLKVIKEINEYDLSDMLNHVLSCIMLVDEKEDKMYYFYDILSFLKPLKYMKVIDKYLNYFYSIDLEEYVRLDNTKIIILLKDIEKKIYELKNYYYAIIDILQRVCIDIISGEDFKDLENCICNLIKLYENGKNEKYTLEISTFENIILSCIEKKMTYVDICKLRINENLSDIIEDILTLGDEDKKINSIIESYSKNQLNTKFIDELLKK